MIEQLLQAILAQVKEPKADMEKNLRALLAEMVTRMDLVTQDELARQQHALIQAQRQLAALNQQIALLTQQLEQLQATSARQ